MLLFKYFKFEIIFNQFMSSDSFQATFSALLFPPAPLMVHSKMQDLYLEATESTKLIIEMNYV